MFAITKQQRIKKLLIANTESYHTLNLAYAKSKLDSSELGLLKSEQLRIDMLKVCFVYDELKLRYKGFSNAITNNTELWRTCKPSGSAGTVFYSYLAPNVHIPYKVDLSTYTIHNHFLDATTKNFQTNASSMVINAMKIKLKKNLFTIADELGLRRSSFMLKRIGINHILLYLELKTLGINMAHIQMQPIQPFELDLFQLIAKGTKTNILLSES